MQTSQPALISLAFAALALLLDAVVLLLAGTHAANLRALQHAALGLPFLFGHLALTALLGLGWWRARQRLAQAPGTVLTLILMLFLGPLGAAVSCLAALLRCMLPASWANATPVDTARSDASPTRAALPAGQAQEPEALCDVFRHGTLAERRRAVALMGSHFKPQFAEALRMAIKDENNAIRVQAGMVLLQLEDEYGRQQLRIEERGEERLLATHGFGTDQTPLELARLHDNQAYSGLLDANRTRTAQLHALRAYREHLAANPDDEDAMAAVGRLLVRADQHELVADWFTQLVAKGNTSAPVLLWLAEALYRSRRYPELQALLRQHRSRIAAHLPEDSPLRGVLQLWQGATPGGDDARAG